MLTGGNYYGMQLATTGPSTTAYFFVNVLSPGALVGAAVSMYPSATQATYFSSTENSLQFNAPAAVTIGAATTVLTSGNDVAGSLGVSPPIQSDVTLSLYGSGGVIGTVTLEAGQTQMPFDFRVTPSESLGHEGGAALLRKQAPRPEA
jgi:hypothetical protein